MRSETDTSLESRAGSTRASPTRRRPWTSTAPCSAGSSRTSCRRTPRASTSWRGSAAVDVAAVGSIPEGAPQMATWNTYIWVDSADDTAAKVKRGRRQRADGAVRRHGRGPDGGLRRPRGRRVLRLAGEGAQGRAGRQRARQRSTSTCSTPGTWRARSASTARSSAGRRSISAVTAGCGRCPGYGDHLEETSPGLREGMERDGRARGLRGRRGERRPRSPPTSRTPRRTGA